jgi:predicted nucleotidyltransferase
MSSAMTTLLQKMTEERAARTERLRLTVREELRAALREILPGTPVTIFGSLAHEGRFTDASDVDLALAAEPAGSSVYQLIAAQLPIWSADFGGRVKAEQGWT